MSIPFLLRRLQLLRTVERVFPLALYSLAPLASPRFCCLSANPLPVLSRCILFAGIIPFVPPFLPLPVHLSPPHISPLLAISRLGSVAPTFPTSMRTRFPGESLATGQGV